MSVAFIATPSVRHIGVWVAESLVPADQDARHYWMGGWRAICGQPTHDNTPLLFDRELSPDAEAMLGAAFLRQLRAGMRRPVCSRCTAVAAAVQRLASSAVTS